jgi:hypothetical protein
VEGEIMLCHILDERGGSEPWIPEKKNIGKKDSKFIQSNTSRNSPAVAESEANSVKKCIKVGQSVLCESGIGILRT